MKEKMKNHFIGRGPRRFVIGTVLLLLITDILNFFYLRLYWLKKDLSTNLVHQMFQRNGYLLENFSTDTVIEMKAFVDNTFYFFLTIVLINNVFFYFFYYRKKLWAQGFVLFYTLSAALLSVTYLLDLGLMGWSWAIYNFSTIFLYAYLFLGVKLLKYETTDAIPPHEKSEQ